MIKNLQNLFDDEMFEKMGRHFDQLMLMRKHQQSRVKKIFDTLSVEDLKVWVPKFLKWEEKYEDFWYDKGVQTTSNLFSTLIDMIQTTDGCKQIKNQTEDFLAKTFTWNGYKFKLYCGQGSFWRIMKGKEIIFQST